ncbi:MAG: nuclear transport factor 2 family protein [Gemmatimonadota bacterium]|nr:MAG: nuclear transport factor 2 family protein [Gemmatimonadota bacterium]
MKKRSWLMSSGILLLGCGSSDTTLQEVALPAEEQQIVTVVQRLFNGIEARDTALLARLLDSGAQLVSVREVAGVPRWARRTKTDFLTGIAANEATMVERMWDPEVRIDGDIATLWAPYDFYIDGEFSHCGYDAFHLTRHNGRWSIAAITYTVRTSGCEDAPPATYPEN